MMAVKTVTQEETLNKHGVVKNKNFLCGVPIKVASQQQKNMAYSMMMYMMGSMARVVFKAVDDFHQELSEDASLYKQETKKNIREIEHCCKDLKRAFLRLADIDMLHDSWLNITSTILQSVSLDRFKLQLTLKNEVFRAKCEPASIITNFLLAFNYSSMLRKTAEEFGRFLHEEVGMGSASELSQSLTLPIKGIYDRLKKIGDVLMDKDTDKIEYQSQPVLTGLEIIQKKLLSWDNIAEACHVEAKANGIALTDEDMTDERINARQPWNDVQDRVLILGYGKFPDKELAQQLGRSEAAVRARARKIGLKKNKS